jgi:hypothetical protein
MADPSHASAFYRYTGVDDFVAVVAGLAPKLHSQTNH